MRARDREDHRTGRRIHRGERDHLGPFGQLDACHTARRAPLRPHLPGRVAQQLRVVRDEDQILIAGAQFGRADDPVTVPEADDLQLVLVGRVVGHHPLDDALFGTDRQTG